MRAAEEDIEQGASTVPSLEAIDEDRESLHLSTVQEEGSSLHLSDLGSLHQPLFQGESHDADEDEDENDSNSDDALRGPPGILSDSSRDSYSETLADDSETSTSVSQLGTSDHSTLNGRRSSSTRGLTRTKARHDLNNDTQRSMTSTQGQMVQVGFVCHSVFFLLFNIHPLTHFASLDPPFGNSDCHGRKNTTAPSLEEKAFEISGRIRRRRGGW